MQTWSNRYHPSTAEGCYLYSGFMVFDAEAEKPFLGMVNLGPSTTEGVAEIARLNRVDTWSHPIKDSVIKEYKMPEKEKLRSSYKGLGTAETSVLWQYGDYLRAHNHKLKGKPLEGLCATARLDNPGSWKSSAKVGFKLTGIDVNPDYGPKLRYQLGKKYPT